MGKYIHCPIYGPVYVSDIALMFIDTIEFQRLHSIKQTGMCYKVFPSATHSRWIHSIGTYGLAVRLLTRLQERYTSKVVSSELFTGISLAALLHDIGHGPFSHVFEQIVKKCTDPKWCHENQSIRIIDYMVFKYNIPLSPSIITLIKECIVPPDDKVRKWEYQIVSNHWNGIDVDKMDYLRRDAKMLDIGHTFSVDRILLHTHIKDGELVYGTNVAHEIVGLYYHRYHMYRNIYQHRVVVACDGMLHRIIESLPDVYNSIYEIDNFVRMTDDVILYLASSDMLQQLQERQLVHTDNHCSADIVGSIQTKEPGIVLRRVMFTTGQVLNEMKRPSVRFIGQLQEENWI